MRPLYPFRRLLLLLIIMLFAAPFSARAQLDTLIYGAGSHIVDPEATGELRATVEAMPFFRDNEYKGEFVKGYTLPGAWLQPRLSYQPLRNLQIEVGAHMLHFWGANKYPCFNYSGLANWQGKNVQTGFHCVPVVRGNLQLASNVNLILGTLYGQANHGLAAPLYNDELNLGGDPETGVQVLWDARPVHLDAWVNWESFIFNNDRGQESFSFGLSTRFRPSRREARAQWSLPLQLIFQHRGGEVNTEATERSIKTWLNAAAGVAVNVPLDTRVPVALSGELTATAYRQQAGTALPFSSGYGLYAQAGARVWRCEAKLGYWRAHHFVSIFGNPLFGSIGVSEPGITYPNPHMLTFHADYTQPLGRGFAWGVAVDVFHHFTTDLYTPAGYSRPKGQTSLAAGIYLRACPSFLIKRFRQGRDGETK